MSLDEFLLQIKGCVHYLNRCTTSPMYILYRLKAKNELTITYYIFFYLTHCHFCKRCLPAHNIFSTNNTEFMKFPKGKSRQACFQIVWHMEILKRIPLQKSKQLFGRNRRVDKRMRLTVSFMRHTRIPGLWMQELRSCNPSLGSLEDISPAKIFCTDFNFNVFFLLSFFVNYSLNETYISSF